MLKPKMILVCKGGIIQYAVANIAIEVTNLDYDIMADGPPPYRESFEDRRKDDIDILTDAKEYEEEEKRLRDEWEAAQDKSLNEES
jgi:hypothetical protein